MRFPSGRRPTPPKLIEAHKLFDQGKYQKAAELYLELAGKAEVRGIPQAANLYLRGAAAILKAGSPEEAIKIVKKAFGILIARKNWHQLKKSADVTIERLKSEGYDDLAGEIQTWIEEQVPDHIKGSDAWQMAVEGFKSGSVKLPSTCGQCGGPVNPNEIEWYDSSNPICSYCGAILEIDS
jgi:hypothetical protein